MRYATYVRWLLTALLLYGVYTETGVWTTVCLALITIYIELQVNKDRLIRALS